MPDIVSLNIPVDLRTPGQYVEIDATRAVGTLPVPHRRILVLGQRLNTGTVAGATPVLITRVDQARAYFGRGSMLARMCTALFGTVGQYREVWACALNDADDATKMTKVLTLAGTATVAGTLVIYIAGTRVALGIAAEQTAAATATALVAAINATLDLPVTAAAVGAVVTLTARNAGLCGNLIPIFINYYPDEALPDGLTIEATEGTTGATNPDVTDALAAIAGMDFYTIAVPWTDSANLAAMEDELAARWAPLEVRTGHAFAALNSTVANLVTVGDQHNSPHLTLLGLHRSPTWTVEQAAILAGVCEYHGSIDPARPLQTLPLPGLLAPAIEDRFTRTERDLLLHHGISTTVTSPGGDTLIERVITTYQHDDAGFEDISLLDIETKWTADYIRFAVRQRIAERFPRHKLTDDGTRFAPGQAIVTPRLIRAELTALFRDLEAAGLVERFDQFAADLVVVRSGADPNRVDAIIPPDLVNQFRVFAAAVQFRL